MHPASKLFQNENNLDDLQNDFERQIIVGSILIWPKEEVPNDRWIHVRGQSLDKTSYPELFQQLGYMYGGSPETGKFNLPDYRGMFLRGTDTGRGSDPDANSRASRGDGEKGDVVGTTQADAFESHRHPHVDSYAADTSRADRNRSGSSIHAHDVSRAANRVTGVSGSNETRPKNINVNFIIKAR